MTYISEVVADAPVHWWRFADPGGQLAHDIGSAPFHMHGVGNPTLGFSGPVSGGGSVDLSLDGIYTNTGTGLTLPANQPLTFECWYWNFQHLTTTTGELMLWGNNDVLLNHQTDRWGWTYGLVGVTSIANFTAQQWHHLVGTADGTNIKLYVDGVLRSTAAAAFRASVTGLICVSETQTASNFGNGFFAEAAIYYSALSAARIAAHFAAADQVAQAPVFTQAGKVDLTTSSVTSAADQLAAILAAVRHTF